MISTSKLAVIVSLLASSALAAPAPAVPDTPSGRLGAELVRHLNSDTPEALKAWAGGVYEDEDRADFVAAVLAAQAESGGVDLVAARPGFPDHSAAVLTLKARRMERYARLSVFADPNDPSKVRHADISPVESPQTYAGWPTTPVGDAEVAALAKAGLDTLVRTTDFSGCVSVEAHGAVLYSACRGLAERSFGAPANATTKFHLGSMDKMFTAIAIGQLVEAGKLSWDTTLAEALPEYPDQETARKITIWQLLHHTSGLGDFFSPEFFRDREKYVNPADYVGFIAKRPKRGEPGKRWSYSNAGFVLLGRIVEVKSGESYFDYVARHVFTPAGMTATGFDSLTDVTPDLAVGYLREDPFGVGPWKSNLTTLPFKGGPAGGGYSTTVDLLRFAAAFQHGKLLKPETIAKMFEDPAPVIETLSYASGFEDRVSSGQHIRGHSGGAPGMNAALEMLPDGSAVAVVMNGSGSPRDAQVLADHIADLLAARQK
jgi:CubicO group peptidase (beta-lactamase class C family)